MRLLLIPVCLASTLALLEDTLRADQARMIEADLVGPPLWLW